MVVFEVFGNFHTDNQIKFAAQAEGAEQVVECVFRLIEYRGIGRYAVYAKYLRRAKALENFQVSTDSAANV
jgi:hypothetical protein